MFQDDQIYSLAMFAIVAYLFYMWLGDLKYFNKNKTMRKGAFAGATPVSASYVIVAILCAAGLLLSHIATEYGLGIENAQTKFSAWAIFSWCAAAFIEELIFRGYLVVQNKGAFALVASIIGFSIIFAAAHPFVWNYEVPEGASIFNGVWKFDFSIQPLISTLAIFECSLLFYILRFYPANKNRSLIPCIAAHLTYNVGVFVAKFVQGFIS